MKDTTQEEFYGRLQRQSARLDKVARRLKLLARHESFNNNNETDEPAVAIEQSEDDSTKTTNVLEVLRRNAQLLEQQVAKIRGGLDRWCCSVLGIELLILVLVTGLIVAWLWFTGYRQEEQFMPLFQELVTYRPILSSLIVIFLLILGFWSHYSIRSYVADKIADRLLKEGSDARLSRAFLKNCTPWHSVFHPQPVGWNYFQRRRMQKVHQALDEIEGKLAPEQSSEGQAKSSPASSAAEPDSS